MGLIMRLIFSTSDGPLVPKCFLQPLYRIFWFLDHHVGMSAYVIPWSTSTQLSFVISLLTVQTFWTTFLHSVSSISNLGSFHIPKNAQENVLYNIHSWPLTVCKPCSGLSVTAQILINLNIITVSCITFWEYFTLEDDIVNCPLSFHLWHVILCWFFFACHWLQRFQKYAESRWTIFVRHSQATVHVTKSEISMTSTRSRVRF